MSNCDVGSGGIWLPKNIVAQHGIEDYDHFSHDGDNSDFGLLVGIGEAKVEGCEGRIVSSSAQSGHVEHVADWQPATVDATMSFEPTAVEVIRREANKGGNLLAPHLAEFRQQRDEAKGERGADAPHRGQQFITPRETGIAGDDLCHPSVEQKNIGLKARQAAFIEAPQHGILEVRGLVLDRDMLVAKLAPHGDNLSKPLSDRIALHDACRHDRDIFCDQPCIEVVVLSQYATGTSKLAQLIGVDPSDRQTCREQRSDDTAFVPTTRLEPDCGNRPAAQPLDQLAATGGAILYRKELPLRQYHYVQTILRYVDSAIALLYHLRAPSLLMRVHALATVREWKKRREHQAHSRCVGRGGCGLPVATGAAS